MPRPDSVVRRASLVVTVLLLTATVTPASAVATTTESGQLSSQSGDALTAATGVGSPPPKANVTGLPDSGQSDASEPSLVGFVANPYADEDAGEYVVVEFPHPTNTTGWTLVDDAGAVASLPAATLEDRVVLSPEPEAVELNESVPVHPLGGQLQLANGGDALELRRTDGSAVAATSYDDAPEGERYALTDDGWQWRVPGTTSLDPVTTEPDRATAFVLPDAPAVVESQLRAAEQRILLGGYTLTSDRVLEALLDAESSGVTVRVLLEGSPVGGVSQQQADALDRLRNAGVQVTVLAGPKDPFGVHHAKYVVVDDSALVLTENFKPAGTGGHSSRGWGVVVEGGETATELASLFHADRTGPGAVDWTDHRSSIDPVPGGSSTQTYPTHFTPKDVPLQQAELLVAPDNARSNVETLLRSANDSIRIQQMGIEGIDDPLLQAAIDAARNGTDVEVLLSSANYAVAENRALVTAIDRLAERDALPIDAKLVDPRGRFSKVHAKVAIVDERHVVLGSLNWNPAAYEENREVVLVLTGEEIAAYYTAVFDADARDEPLWPVPTGIVVAVCVLWVALALLAVARIRWAA